MELPSQIDLKGLAIAIGQAAEAVVITDENASIRYVNAAFLNVTGYTAEEVLGRNPRLLRSGKHGAAFYRDLWKTISGGHVWTGEVVNRRKNGSLYIEKMKITPLKEPGGRITGYLAFKEDVSERHKAEKDQALFASIVESSGDAIISLAPDGTILSWNKAAERIYGYPACDVLGRKNIVLAPADRRDEFRQMRDRLASSGRIEQFHTVRKTKGGDLIDISLTASPLYDRNGELAGISAIARDITVQNRVEQALRVSESRYRRLVESGLIGVAIADPAGRILDANQAFLKMHGYCTNDLCTGLYWQALLASADELAREAILKRLAKPGNMTPAEVAHLRKDGSLVQVMVGLTSLEEPGKLSMAIVHDLTRTRLAEQALRISERRLQAIVGALDDLVLEVDPNGTLLRISGRNPTLFSPLGESLTGHNGAAVVGSEFMAPVIQTVNEVIRTGQAQVRERHRDCNGERRWYRGRYSPIQSEDGTCRSVCLMVSDITQQKQQEEELRHAKEAAERASRAKDEFLSRVSHELRTPLNTILGFAQLLDMEEATAIEKDNIARILRAGRHLLGLVNEVLEISRIESGRLQLEVEPVRCPEVVFAALEMIRPLMDARAIELIHHEIEGGGPPIFADRQRLIQVLLNLLSNAVKYNRDGGTITVSYKLANPNQLQIMVTDTGVGIAAELVGMLFAPFQRLGAERTSVEGTGLGLSLSRGLVELMNGEIGVESVEGSGSTFWVKLPVVQTSDASPPSVPVATTHPDASSTVLYIEDNAAYTRLVAGILKHRPQVRLITATHGTLGLELARRHLPALILLDLYLLDCSGLGVLEELQRDPLTAKIPVAVVTADSMPSTRQQLLAAGARTYLTKPLDVKRLLAIVDEYVQRKVMQ